MQNSKVIVNVGQDNSIEIVKKDSNIECLEDAQITLTNFCRHDFTCGDLGLTTLKGSPVEVLGDFNCYNNNLRNLHHSPRFVGGDFNCFGNIGLTSFIGCPEKINKNAFLTGKNITELDALPNKIGESCYLYSTSLLSLRNISKFFKGGYIRDCLYIPPTIISNILGTILIPELKSLYVGQQLFDQAVPTLVYSQLTPPTNPEAGDIWLNTSSGIKHMYTGFSWTIIQAPSNLHPEIANIQSNNLQLRYAVDIINKHLKTGRNIIDCQRELIKAGLKEFAKL